MNCMISVTMEKQSLEAKIRYQVACEEKAHRLVVQLVEPGITEEDLVEAGLCITPAHYQDITEERAISKLCGYPICQNQIKKVLNQKYHISTKTNTVYDITDRKNFCSNECYKASVYYQKQISTSPLWSRREEKPKPIHLLPNEFNRGSMGKEVIDTQTEIYREAKRYMDEVKREQREKVGKAEGESRGGESEEKAEDLTIEVEKLAIQVSPKSNTILDKRRETGKSIGKTDHSKKSNRKAEMTVNSTVTSNDQQKEKVDRLMALLDRRKHLLGRLVQDERTVTKEETQNTNVYHSKSKETEKEEDSDKSCDQPHSENEAQCEDKQKCDIIHSKIKVMDETVSTVSDEKKEQEMPEGRGSSSRVPAVEVSYLGLVCEMLREWITPETRRFVESPDMEGERLSASGSEMEVKIRALCRRVDQQEAALDDLIGEEDSLEEQLPVRSRAPDYTALKRDTQEFTNRVQDYMSAGKVIKEKASDSQTLVYLPSVDSSDQLLIRQKIVMEQLNKVISDLLPPLKLTIQDVFAELKQLVRTFRLTSNNIVFKPAEWSLVGLILLKLVSRRSLRVSCAFLNSSALHYFSVFLGGINENLENVDLYVTGLLQEDNK